MTGREVLRDKYGNILGEIRIDGSKQTLWDKYSIRLVRMIHMMTGPATNMETQWVEEICWSRC